MINTYEKNQILNNIFRNGEKTIYIGVSKTAPSEDGTNCTEPTASSYKRLLQNVMQLIGTNLFRVQLQMP